MIGYIILIVILIILSVYFGVLVGFNNVVFWIVGGLIIGFIGALIKHIIKTKNSSSKAEEIKKYKNLLDSGAITQEEFERKKKEILDK